MEDHQKTKDQQKSFETIINCTYTIQEHLLEIAVCSLIMLVDYPQNLTNADILGQENLNLVSEKSGKSQGILLSIICGNPDKVRDKKNEPKIVNICDCYSCIFYMILPKSPCKHC